MHWSTVVFAGFCATFVLYLDRVGFPLAYGEVARSSGLNDATKGFVLSMFYYGYAATQILGGIAADKVGGQVTLAIGLLSSGLLSLAAVFVITDPSLVSFVRVLCGAAQGFVIPSIHNLLGKTVTPAVKSRATSMTVSGMYAGSTVALSTLPQVIASWGAELLLMRIGMSFLVCLAMVPLLLSNGWSLDLNLAKHQTKVAVPQDPCPKRLLMSHAVWAICANSFSFHYSLYLVMNWMPSYFEELIEVPLKSLGNVKVFPYLALFVSSNLAGHVGDLMIKKAVSVGVTRKFINTAGFLVACVALIFMGNASDGTSGVIAISCTMVGLGFSRGGFSINHLDIAPSYAGFLIGVINMCGTVAGIAGVSFTGCILNSYGGASKRNGWIYACLLALLVNIVCGVFFIVSARGNIIFDDVSQYGKVSNDEVDPRSIGSKV